MHIYDFGGFVCRLPPPTMNEPTAFLSKSKSQSHLLFARFTPLSGVTRFCERKLVIQHRVCFRGQKSSGGAADSCCVRF